MSEALLNLILHRLDAIERGQTERFGQIDQRFGQIEREQTRLRVDLLAQMERVLATVQDFKDDMTVAMAFAARADASSSTTAALQRTMQSQLSHLGNRVERPEDGRGATG